jgi:DNA-binding response OmpR family regulator
MSQSRLPLLYLEDHADTRTVLTRILASWGYLVLAAPTIAAARHLLQTHPVELILADLGLPDGNGWDFFLEARALRPVQGIVLSAWGTHEDRIRSSEVGFGRHLTKPVHMRELGDALAELARPSTREISPAVR